MKNLILISLFSAAAINPVCAQKAPANIRLTEQSMMHESRVTPSPLNGAMVDDRFVSFSGRCRPKPSLMVLPWTVLNIWSKDR